MSRLEIVDAGREVDAVDEDDAYALRWMDDLPAHALADELIQAGFLPLNGRHEFVARFAADPDAVLAEAKYRWAVTGSWWAANEKTDRNRTRFGEQPVYSAINGAARGPDSNDVAVAVSELVGYTVSARSVDRWLSGRSVPPAEVKLAVAQYLGVIPQMCWTEEVMNATYSGPRGVNGCAGRSGVSGIR